MSWTVVNCSELSVILQPADFQYWLGFPQEYDFVALCQALLYTMKCLQFSVMF